MEEAYQSEEPKSSINFIQEGVKIGLINGVFALLLLYGSYFMGLDTFVSVQFFANFIPYMIIILVIYGIQLRKRNGNYLAYKDALQFTFLSYVVAAILLAIGTYILYNVVDKDLTRKSFDLTIEKTRRLMENMTADQDKVDQQIDKLRESAKETNLKNIFLGVGLGLIWDFIKSVLISLIIRKEKRLF
jgi:membrane-bound ClpP family serine protease